MKDNLSQELFIDWNIMCLSVCGKLLPVTTMSIDDENFISMAHEVTMTASPLQFSDGSTGRAIIFKYDASNITKGDIS